MAEANEPKKSVRSGSNQVDFILAPFSLLASFFVFQYLNDADSWRLVLRAAELTNYLVTINFGVSGLLLTSLSLLSVAFKQDGLKDKTGSPGHKDIVNFYVDGVVFGVTAGALTVTAMILTLPQVSAFLWVSLAGILARFLRCTFYLRNFIVYRKPTSSVGKMIENEIKQEPDALSELFANK